jgi:dCMP deaminase
MRISRDEALMRTALLFAQRSTCLRNQVGAVLSVDSRIISTGYNGAPSGMAHCTPETCNPLSPCLRTIHAEMNCIVFAARHGLATHGASLHCTVSPCMDCAKAIINAGIIEVQFLIEYRDQSPVEYLRDAGIHVEKPPLQKMLSLG